MENYCFKISRNYASPYTIVATSKQTLLFMGTHTKDKRWAFAVVTGFNVMPAGLYVHSEHYFLAATPDVVGTEDYLVEVKCPFAGRAEYIRPDPSFPCLGYTDLSETTFRVKTNHKWYFQVQGQLACARKNA